jgi:PAS domain S-box-containing protein
MNSLPEEAAVEREYLDRMGAVSVATLPLKAGDELLGGMSFVSTKRRVPWNEELVEQLKLLAEIFSNALACARALDARFWHTAIVESSDDAIVSENLDGIIMSWNVAAQRLFGYSEVEAIGKPITMLIPYELQQEESIFLEQLGAGEGVQHYETVRITKGGKRVYVSLTLSLVRDSAGKSAGFSEIARDITDRKRTEQVLRESEDRFRLVANSAPMLIWMAGTDKLCTFFNEAWLSFTGRSLEDEVGEGWVSGVHPDDMQRCLDLYTTSFDARVDFQMEYRLKRFDREYRWIVDYGVPRFESDGTFCGYIGSCVDITERKAAAESLQNLAGRLIHAQEEERARIARELHDDFSQSLALQCNDLEQLQKRLPELEVGERARLLKMLKRSKSMCADIRSLSHELHSSKLEFVGLVPAVSGLCEEIGEQYKMK